MPSYLFYLALSASPLCSSPSTRRCRLIVTDLLAGPASGNVLIFVGLTWTLIVGVRWATKQYLPVSRSAFGTPVLVLWAPQLLIAVPFFLAGSPYAIWVPAVAAAVVALGTTALRLLTLPPRAGSGFMVSGPAMTAVLVTSVLAELGALLAVRLVVVPDPYGGAGSAFDASTLRELVTAVVAPLAGIAIMLLLLSAARVRGRALRLARWATATDRLERIHRGRLTLAIFVAVAVPFALPLASGGGGAALTVGPMATPEYGKLLLLAALAFFAARDSARFRGVSPVDAWRDIWAGAGGRLRPTVIRAFYRSARFAVLPLMLFAVVAFASAARHDFGTVVPAALAVTGVTWAATRQNIEAYDPALGRAALAVRLVRAYRIFIAVGIVLIAGAAALFSTDYIGERGRVWNDPWVYRWDAGCVPVSQPADVAELVPDGRTACWRSLAADAESERSQLARAIAATADGGLWGRGLRDTASGAVSAGSTDFILAVVWNKLGALTVVAVAGLVVLLGAVLVRAGPHPESAPRPAIVTLFAAGLGAVLVGQFLFVLAATANVVPHTGIPAPFLSRGGQSLLVLVTGIVAVLAVARSQAHERPAGRSLPAPYVPAAPLPPPRTLTAVVLVSVMVLIVAGLTVVPYSAPRLADLRLPTAYAEDRVLCPARTVSKTGLTSAAPDPENCSTDQIAARRTGVEVRFAGRPGLLLDRDAGEWRPRPGVDLGGLTSADMTGLLRVGGGAAGMLDRTYQNLIGGTAGSDLRRRLTPPPRAGRADGGLDLTIDPALQHRLATALRDAGSPGAVVVLDAGTGQVLAAATAPDAPAPVAPAPVDAAAADAFADAHPGYGRPTGDGDLGDHSADPTCPRRTPDPGAQRGCWRWSYTEGQAAARPAVNRALAVGYPGSPAADLVRTAAASADRPLERAGPPTSDVLDQAARFGITPAGCSSPDRWTADRLAGSVGSCLSGDDEATLARQARLTPLATAAVMASLTNGGHAVHPVVVQSVTHPATGVTTVTRSVAPGAALTPGQVARLRATCTSVVLGGVSASVRSGRSAAGASWHTGFLTAGDRQVAYAVVVETPDETAGADRAGQLARTVGTAIGGIR